MPYLASTPILNLHVRSVKYCIIFVNLGRRRAGCREEPLNSEKVQCLLESRQVFQGVAVRYFAHTTIRGWNGHPYHLFLISRDVRDRCSYPRYYLIALLETKLTKWDTQFGSPIGIVDFRFTFYDSVPIPVKRVSTVRYGSILYRTESVHPKEEATPFVVICVQYQEHGVVFVQVAGITAHFIGDQV